MHSQYESTNPEEMTVSSQTFQTEVINNEPKKSSRTAWKGEYEKMKLRFTVTGIIAGLQAVVIVVLILKFGI